MTGSQDSIGAGTGWEFNGEGNRGGSAAAGAFIAESLPASIFTAGSQLNLPVIGQKWWIDRIPFIEGDLRLTRKLKLPPKTYEIVFSQLSISSVPMVCCYDNLVVAASYRTGVGWQLHLRQCD
jgi:hypothetical protein